MAVPFLDLKAQHESLREEILGAVAAVLEQSAFAGGPSVDRFEEEFARYCGVRFAVGVGNGTDALWFALLALGVGPGDEVITAANSFIATAEAIIVTGAKPVFVDIDEESHTLDAKLLERAITPRTKAIIPVHLYGQMADMDPIMEVARRHNLWVVEDAAQAHGAEYKGRRAGSFGHVGCFSFYPSKNLGACGEAGACVTNDSELRNRIAQLREHGQSQRYHHDVVGWNGRMDGMQASILSIKLKRLEAWTEARRTHARAYDKAFAKVQGVLAPKEAAHARHVYHLYVLRVANRDRVLRNLARRGIGCAVHYPVPLHLQKACSFLGGTRGSFPASERCAQEIISLPMYPELSTEQISEVVREVSAEVTQGSQPVTV